MQKQKSKIASPSQELLLPILWLRLHPILLHRVLLLPLWLHLLSCPCTS